MKKSNKGFSLVELIIVIAIMAILVGIMAPQLIKYIEKSKVTADLEMLNAIYAAITYAATDPDVVQDAASMAEIDAIAATPTKIEDIDLTTMFAKEALDSLGWTDFSQSNYIDRLKSVHTGASTIYVQYKGSVNNPLAMWITNTDMTGGRDSSQGTVSDWRDLNDSSCKLICIK